MDKDGDKDGDSLCETKVATEPEAIPLRSGGFRGSPQSNWVEASSLGIRLHHELHNARLPVIVLEA